MKGIAVICFTVWLIATESMLMSYCEFQDQLDALSYRRPKAIQPAEPEVEVPTERTQRQKL